MKKLILLTLLACGGSSPERDVPEVGPPQCVPLTAVYPSDLERVKNRCLHWTGFRFYDLKGEHAIYICEELDK
jgi:hypothetical protein